MTAEEIINNSFFAYFLTHGEVLKVLIALVLEAVIFGGFAFWFIKNTGKD
jgi:hypothetical protein